MKVVINGHTLPNRVAVKTSGYSRRCSVKQVCSRKTEKVTRRLESELLRQPLIESLVHPVAIISSSSKTGAITGSQRRMDAELSTAWC